MLLTKLFLLLLLLSIFSTIINYYIIDCKTQLGEPDTKNPQCPSREDKPIKREKTLQGRETKINKTKQQKI